MTKYITPNEACPIFQEYYVAVGVAGRAEKGYPLLSSAADVRWTAGEAHRLWKEAFAAHTPSVVCACIVVE